MLHTILVILKIAGIIIAAILGIILLMLLGILFIPVRYSSRGEFFEEKKLIFRASWLLRIVHFKFVYDGAKAVYALRIFGIKVFGSDKKRKEKKRAGKKDEDGTEQDDYLIELTEIKKEDGIETSGSPAETFKNTEAEKKNAGGTEDKDKEPLKDKIKGFLKNISDKIKALYEKVKRFIARAKEVAEKIKKILDLLGKWTTKQAIKYLRLYTAAMIKHFLPRKVSASVKFGLGSPDITGRALGYLAVVYGMLGKRAESLAVVPDFDNRVFEGSYKLKGRIRLCHVALFLIRVVSQNQIRFTYIKIKKEILR